MLVCEYVCVLVCVYLYTCVYMCMGMYAYVCMYMRMYVYACMCQGGCYLYEKYTDIYIKVILLNIGLVY